MQIRKIKDIYRRAASEEPMPGINSGTRQEPTLDEARAELSEAISRVATSLLKDKYGLFLGEVSQPVVNELLKVFETNLARAKLDSTLVVEEILNRVVPRTLDKWKSASKL